MSVRDATGAANEADDPSRSGVPRAPLAELMAAIDGIVWEAEAATFRFTFVSESAERLLGYPRARWLAEPGFWEARIHPEDRAATVETCRQETAAGRNHEFEYRMIAADGRVVHLHDRVTVVSEGGVPRFLRGIMLDVTARRAAEEACRESERRYRDLFDGAPDPILLVSADRADFGRILDANEVAAATRGYTREELLRLNLRDLHLPEAAAAMAGIVQRVATEGQCRFETTHRRKDGSCFPVEVHARHMAVNGRKCNVAFCRDITAQKRAAAQVAAAEERWHFALDGAGQGVWDWNLETDEVFYSRQWKAMLGYADDEVANRLSEWERLVHPEDKEPALATVQRHLSEQSAHIISEMRMRCRDGSWKWVLSRGKVIEHSADGRPRRIIGTHTDVDAQKREQREVLRAKEGLTLALNAAQLGTFWRDLATGEAGWDARMREIAGLAPDAPVPGPYWPAELTDDANRERVRRSVEVNLTQGGEFSGEYPILRADGQTRHLRVRGRVLVGADGRPHRVTGVVADVTDEVRAAETLRATHAHLESIFQSTTEGLVLHRADGRIVECNPAAQRILGRTREQLNGTAPTDSPWPAVREDGTEFPAEEHPATVTLRTGEPQRECVMGVQRPDGSRAWLSMNTEPVFGAAGTPEHVVTSFTDVTEKRAADRALRQTTERLRHALVTARMIWWEWNARTGAVHIDACGAPCIVGYGEGELAGMTFDTWMERIHPDDRGAVKKSFEAMAAGDSREWASEHRLRSPRGDYRWVRDAGVVTRRDAAGKPHLVAGCTQEVHERHVVEMNSAAAAQRLQIALDASGMGVWRHNLRTGASEWDRRMFELYGIPPEGGALDAAAFNRTVFAEDLPKIEQAWRDLHAGTVTEFEYHFRICRTDGAVRHLRSVGEARPDAQGRPEWITGINEDITERVESANKRRLLEAQLAQVQKLETLGTLAGGVAHDFNNLLTGILGFTELARAAVPAAHPVVPLLQQARSGALQARELVKRLLLFSRRAPETERRALSLAQLVRETLPLIGVTVPASIEVRVDADGNVPDVLANPSQLQQVLVNLCVNAAQAIGPRQGTIRIGLACAALDPGNGVGCAPGNYACLTVSDSGCGMDAATLRRIFDPFFTTKVPGEGTGLGLSIVHGIVQEHRGAIRALSTPGHGSIFEVFLPAAAALPESVAPKPPASRPVGGGRAVLVADDELLPRKFVRTLLEKSGFAVTSAGDGLECAARFAAAPDSFGLAVLDLAMPGKTGAELIREIRAVRPDLPILLMSGDHERYGNLGIAQFEAVAVLTKPFTPDEFFGALQKLPGIDAARPEPPRPA